MKKIYNEYVQFMQDAKCIYISSICEHKGGVAPEISYSPCIVDKDKNTYILVSTLTKRTESLLAERNVSLMFIEPEEQCEEIYVRTRLILNCTTLQIGRQMGTNFDLLLRVLIMVTLFASAYMAEVIRGGLQAISRGQHEAGDSLGLTYWQANRLIVLPQALKISIPGIVNTFIGLYKDTTLVLIIGMMDILALGGASLADAKWAGLANEIYLFVALYFFVTCFSMSRYSLYLEKKLHTGH